MRHIQHRLRRGITLIELVVVLAILGVAAALALPGVLRARHEAQQNECRMNLHKIGLALHNYHDAFRQFPPGWIAADTKPQTGPCFGWGAMLLPFVDHARLYNELNFSRPPEITDDNLRTRIDAYRCPADTSLDINPVRDEFGTSNYSGNFGDVSLPGSVETPTKANGMFFWNSSVSFRQLTDGASNVFCVGERSIASAAAIWMGVRSNQNAGDAVTACPHAARLNTVLDSFSSRHEGESNFLMCDGAVRFISDDIDSQPGGDPPQGTYQRLAHKSDGQAVGEF